MVPLTTVSPASITATMEHPGNLGVAQAVPAVVKTAGEATGESLAAAVVEVLA